MLFKRLVLENIRSYSNQVVEFPTGSVLLAGDIGSGKSTILLAIEFALFGIKAGELSGETLLRHGKKEGSVELSFNINGKDIVVKRTLKRVKDKIGQAAGYMIEDGVKTELMPKELRSRIFQLLNYPESLVSKGQDLIYRFTVYTPQEEMRKIIYAEKEGRLDTLRKVFNIDKYKRVRENALMYVKSLKDKRNNLEGRVADTEGKKKQLEELNLEVDMLVLKEREIQSRVESAKQYTLSKRMELEKIDLEIKESNNIKKEIALLDLELRNVIDKREKDKREIEDLQNSILRLREELKDFKDELSLQPVIEDKERRIQTLEKELIIVRKDMAEIKGKTNLLRQSSDKIIRLDNCPLCLQSVKHDHKEEIVGKTEKEINCLLDKYREFELREKEFNANLVSIKNELKELVEKVSQSKVLRVKKDNLIEKEKRLNLLKDNFDEVKKKIASINSRKMEVSHLVKPELEKQHITLRKEYDELLMQERKVELEKNSVSKEIEGLKKQTRLLEEELKEKEKLKQELHRIVQLQNWLEDKFVNLVANIEKHMLMTVYYEFNELFQRWFTMLIEDQNLSVRLDDSFSVVIQQNGYETFIENLSGGEKTSVALAYRLALNKVINDVVSQIRTKDILILDEPTEGFSSAQLDRVRDVLDQLGIKQIIIVSHESKIETFVDNIIRVTKSEGVSLIG